MRININIDGSSPLMMHNEQLSDPSCEFTKMIKEITDKKTNQTDADREQVRRLEWQGGLYIQNGKIVVPAANVVRAFRESAALTKLGKKLAGSVIPIAMYFPLIYDGPTDLEELYNDARFVDGRQVKVSRGRIKRTRPIFHQWGLRAEFELIETALNLSALEAIVERAGQVIGLGDGRIIGYGRFGANVVAATAKILKAA